MISILYTLESRSFSLATILQDSIIEAKWGRLVTPHSECSTANSDHKLAPDYSNQTFESILADDMNALDPTLSATVSELKVRGAHRCWHKHSTFLEHLIGVHHILRLWGQGPIIGRVGLLHSAYSNSYVNLALFNPNQVMERERMRSMVGTKAEELIYLFCNIDRQQVVVHTLLKQGFIPDNGLNVTHIRDDEEIIHLTPDILQLLVVFTMADVADQYFEWQDILFGGSEQQNSMLKPGLDDLSKHESTTLWPGLSRPGLWMHYVSELGAVARTYYNSQSNVDQKEIRDSAERLEINIPPVFDYCTEKLSRQDEAESRSLYWSVVTRSIPDERMIDTLKECIRLNPWTFEPHVMLAQLYLHQNEYDYAKRESERALELQQLWGTAWDKRLGFAAWVAWTRVLCQRATDRLLWPENSWDVNNFGMVR